MLDLYNVTILMVILVHKNQLYLVDIQYLFLEYHIYMLATLFLSNKYKKWLKNYHLYDKECFFLYKFFLPI
mgnify:CR=1 FL=1